MAAVFDGKTKIGRAVADPGTDDMLPVPGSLVLGAITTPVALSGTVGAECKLVHGDRWQQIDGNQTEFVVANLMTTISGNQIHQVTSNQTILVAGNVARDVTGNQMTTITGPEIKTNVGPYNHSYVAPRVVAHAGEENKEETGSFMWCIETLEKLHIAKFEATAMTTEVVGAKFESVAGLKCEVVNAEVSVETTENGIYVAKVEAGANKNLFSALVNKVNGTEARMQALDADIGPAAETPPESIPGVVH